MATTASADRVEADPRDIDCAFDPATASRVRELHTDQERRAIASTHDMTPAAPHPDPRLAAKAWQASNHGTYVRRPPEPEMDAG